MCEYFILFILPDPFNLQFVALIRSNHFIFFYQTKKNNKKQNKYNSLDKEINISFRKSQKKHTANLQCEFLRTIQPNIQFYFSYTHSHQYKMEIFIKGIILCWYSWIDTKQYSLFILLHSICIKMKREKKFIFTNTFAFWSGESTLTNKQSQFSAKHHNAQKITFEHLKRWWCFKWKCGKCVNTWKLNVLV